MQQNCPLIRNGRIIAMSSFCSIFKNPFYSGVFRWNGKTHQGSHRAMITPLEFEKVQKITTVQKSVKNTCLEFDLKGIVNCQHCNAILTAEQHKKTIKTTGKEKIFRYYRCCHNKRDIPCTEKPINEIKLEEQILEIINNISIPQEILEFEIEDIKRRKFQKQNIDQEKNLQKEVTQWEKKIQNTMKQFLEEEDDDMRVMMRNEIKKMKDFKNEIEAMILKIEGDKQNKKKNILNALNISKIAQKVFLHGKKSQKRAVLLGIGSNWKIGNKLVEVKHHKEVFALTKLKKFPLGGKSIVRTDENSSTIKKTPYRESLNDIWSG